MNSLNLPTTTSNVAFPYYIYNFYTIHYYYITHHIQPEHTQHPPFNLIHVTVNNINTW